MSMYAVKFWKHIGIPESYAIIDKTDRDRYIAFFQSDKADVKYWVDGNQVKSQDLLQTLRMADKVNSKEVTLISRYAGQPNNIFAGIVPANYRTKRKTGHRTAQHSMIESSADGYVRYKLRKIDIDQLSDGDVLYNAFLLCKNPFEPNEPFEWVMSFKSTICSDCNGNRYAYINDDDTRYRAYAFAESTDGGICSKSPFRIELRSQYKKQPVADKQTLVYKGADMERC